MKPEGYNRAIIPNRDGFKLWLNTKHGTVEDEVVLCEDGLHRLRNTPIKDVIGWYPKK